MGGMWQGEGGKAVEHSEAKYFLEGVCVSVVSLHARACEGRGARGPGRAVAGILSRRALTDFLHRLCGLSNCLLS